MWKTIKTVAPKALVFMLIMTLICGLVYPLVVTGISQIAFPKQANGSMIEVNGVAYGSELLAQDFTGAEYLHGRIMNVNAETFADDDGNPLLFAGPTNLSPADENFDALMAERVNMIREENPQMGDTPIPVDLVTSSGSGLDPAISPAGAEYQVKRIAGARGLSEQQVRDVIANNTQGRFLGIFGEPTVNVLKVNLELDGILQ
ncbi:MAG: potassium-transporting ATPase subunit KdpC [Christensenella sp.]|uniref:potassium-transporting ATPase subunit KdpC n=1 Tax=Christensenella sp. TaxID=1935934 RepID=UPI002B214815|nr:potassium-transporting ATPase subunit KdpC [Christensenella sp.]MEA5003191.1 potassium-transporting ATPase subunit KdpC [Christensenella sp.]